MAYKSTAMITFQEAYDIIFSSVKKTDKEKIALPGSPGRILARDILADTDMPPFSRSAMDGYACRRKDTHQPLEIIEEIPAGKMPEKAVSEGTCSKIMTGAPVPEGADRVIRVEDTSIDEQGRMIVTDPGGSSNIRRQGEDMKKNEVIIPRGTMIRSQQVGIMASVGVTFPLVYKKPEAGILSTGSELVPADQTPGLSQIRNSNGPQIYAQLLKTGIQARDYGIVIDRKEILKNKISEAVSENTVVIISGGVSAGDYDYVPELLRELDFKIKMHKMKVRPGKPLLFAEKEGNYVFGVPGNPVSAFVQCEVLINPFILSLMGMENPDGGFYAPLMKDYRHDAESLRFFIPVIRNAEGVIPLEYHGSGHLAAYAEADGILEIPEGKKMLSEGELVYVRPI